MTYGPLISRFGSDSDNTAHLPRLLFVDDDLITHDAGGFEDSRTDEFRDWEGDYPEGAVLGVMHYFHEPLSRNFQITIAHGPTQALQLLNDQSFDIAVVDVMMPAEDGDFGPAETAGGLQAGFVLAEKLRKLSPQLPIWLLSQVVPGNGSQLNEDAVERLKLDGVIVDARLKPDVQSAGVEQFVEELIASLPIPIRSVE